AGDQSFAGLLSKNSSINSDRVKYLGPITRLKIGHKYKGGKNILVMLSGPEPQRTSLENKLIDILQPISQDILFIRGAQKPTPLKLQKLYEYIDLANSVQIEEAIAAATLIICRSGYSTVMDLSIFDKKIIYIPTPGQTEQEYLADYHGFHNEQVTSIVQKALESDLLKVVMKG
ncbi:MAG TPA: glycosyltransferase, partial [Saprospiraceae bacterium]|nr:glycosyltransferase [Saprospiraceae bacterium]